MANDSGNVFSGKPNAIGGVSVNPATNVNLPTDATTALNVAYKQTGYILSDGVAKDEKRTFKTTKDWSGLIIKSSQTEFTATIKFKWVEYLNAEAAKHIYGTSAVTITAPTLTKGNLLAINVKGTEPPHRGWVFDMIDGIASGRIVVGDGQITDVNTATFNADGAAVRDVTVTCYPDVNGNLFQEFFDDGRHT